MAILTPHLSIHFLFTLSLALARHAPQNVAEFYNAVRAKGFCSNELAAGFYSRESGPNSMSPNLLFLSFSYCGDHLNSAGVVYIQGRNGALANMDVDCDGLSDGPSADGRCGRDLSPDEQNATAFCDVVAEYGKGIEDLNPYVHSYVVFGNAPGTRRDPGWRSFDPTWYGVRPLSVVAVVSSDEQVWFGVWGDLNGDDGPKPMVGEASLALATMCGGPGVSGSNGLDDEGFLYLSFTGDEAVPGPDGAKWDAADADEFEKSIEALGGRLLERVQYEAEACSTVGSSRGMMAGVVIVAVMARFRL